jgi:hypothetical protein
MSSQPACINLTNAHGANDHWHNPQVVEAVAAEIVGLLG